MATCNVSIAGLKRDRYREPIFDSTDQLYFRGNETKAHCNTFRKVISRQPLDIQDLLTSAQLSGDYQNDDFLLSTPKPSVLQPESFKGNVAVNQYGIDHEAVMLVDNDHFLTMPRIDSFAQNDTVIDLKKTPKITTDIKNALRNTTKVMVDTKAIPTGKTATKNMPGAFRAKNHLVVQQVDMSIMERQAEKKISKKAFRERIARVIETISVKSKDPNMHKDIERLLRDNVDILNSVVAYAEKDPQFQLALDRLTREHQDILRNGMNGYGYKTGKVSGKSINKNLKEARSVPVSAPMGNISSKGGLDPGLSSTCFLDDRFISPDQLEPLGTVAAPPQPAAMVLPFGNKCRRFEL